MNISKLAWDTEFFKCPVYRMNNDSEEDLCSFIKQLHDPFICYVFTGKNILQNNQIIECGGELVDTKVVFTKKIQKFKKISNVIKEYESFKPNKELYQLAYESGKYSRFKKDSRLPYGTFKNLYNIWIEKSCGNKNTHVFVYENKVIQGFITLSIDSNEMGEIGLFSVNHNCQGKGIGRSLIDFAENYLLEKGINKINVATQLQNKQAFNFYKKAGYNVEKIDNIYHFVNLKYYENPF